MRLIKANREYVKKGVRFYNALNLLQNLTALMISWFQINVSIESKMSKSKWRIELFEPIESNNSIQSTFTHPSHGFSPVKPFTVSHFALHNA